MNNLNKIITAYSLCEFIQYVSKNNQDPMTILDEFSKDCEFLGGDKQLFIESAMRELYACRLLREDGGAAVAAPIANSVGSGGVAGMKPEDLAVPVEAQKRHTSRNSIFKRKKPNTYFKDKDNSY